MTTDPPDNSKQRTQPPPLIDALPDDDLPIRRPRPAPKSDRLPITAASVHYPELDAAMRHANLLRVRGDYAAAEHDLRRALEIDPTSGAAHEMLGDILALDGQQEAALESFREAQTCGASVAIEGKIGRALLQVNRALQLESSPPLMVGNRTLGMIASALIPGLGLALSGKMTAAAISFFGWLITFGLMMALPATRSILTSLGGLAGPMPSAGAQGALFVLRLANLGFYIYSLFETARAAKPSK